MKCNEAKKERVVMNKGLKIMFSSEIPDQFLGNKLREKAHILGIEGTAQVIAVDKKVKIIACGKKESVDQFLDVIHDLLSEQNIYDVEVEPFIKRVDYKGVFRVIE